MVVIILVNKPDYPATMEYAVIKELSNIELSQPIKIDSGIIPPEHIEGSNIGDVLVARKVGAEEYIVKDKLNDGYSREELKAFFIDSAKKIDEENKTLLRLKIEQPLTVAQEWNRMVSSMS